jgi:hypothetical protein
VVSWYTPRWCLLEHLEGGKGPRREIEKKEVDWSSPSSCHGAFGRRMQRRAACFFHAARLWIYTSHGGWSVSVSRQAEIEREQRERDRKRDNTNGGQTKRDVEG